MLFIPALPQFQAAVRQSLQNPGNAQLERAVAERAEELLLGIDEASEALENLQHSSFASWQTPVKTQPKPPSAVTPHGTRPDAAPSHPSPRARPESGPSRPRQSTRATSPAAPKAQPRTSPRKLPKIPPPPPKTKKPSPAKHPQKSAGGTPGKSPDPFNRFSLRKRVSQSHHGPHVRFNDSSSDLQSSYESVSSDHAS